MEIKNNNTRKLCMRYVYLIYFGGTCTYRLVKLHQIILFLVLVYIISIFKVEREGWCRTPYGPMVQEWNMQ